MWPALSEMLYIVVILPKLQIAKLGKIKIKQLVQSHFVTPLVVGLRFEIRVIAVIPTSLSTALI